MRDAYLAELQGPALVEMLGIDDTTFRTRYRGTPFERSKRRGLLRNVAVALGNVGDRSALPALERVAGDTDALIGEHARWAMEQIQAREGWPTGGGPTGESACSGDPGDANLPARDRGYVHP